MRGTKAKRLRKLGLKQGPAPRPWLTDGQRNDIRLRILEAKAAPR